MIHYNSYLVTVITIQFNHNMMKSSAEINDEVYQFLHDECYLNKWGLDWNDIVSLIKCDFESIRNTHITFTNKERIEHTEIDIAYEKENIVESNEKIKRLEEQLKKQKDLLK